MRYDTLSTVGSMKTGSTASETGSEVDIWPYTDYENSISISYLDLLKEDQSCFNQNITSGSIFSTGSIQSHPVFNTDPVPSTT